MQKIPVRKYVEMDQKRRTNGLKVPHTVYFDDGTIWHVQKSGYRHLVQVPFGHEEAVRYDVVIDGSQKYLYEDRSGRWFVILELDPLTLTGAEMEEYGIDPKLTGITGVQ
jgi:hypothetical protein